MTAFQRGESVAFCKSPEQLDSVNAQTVAEAAKAGDSAAIEVYRLCGEMLGMGLSILIDLLNPERIVLGSIYARSGELLEASMRKVIEREALPHAYASCKILPAALGESLGDVAAISVAVNGIQSTGAV